VLWKVNGSIEVSNFYKAYRVAECCGRSEVRLIFKSILGKALRAFTNCAINTFYFFNQDFTHLLSFHLDGT